MNTGDPGRGEHAASHMDQEMAGRFYDLVVNLTNVLGTEPLLAHETEVGTITERVQNHRIYSAQVVGKKLEKIINIERVRVKLSAHLIDEKVQDILELDEDIAGLALTVKSQEVSFQDAISGEDISPLRAATLETATYVTKSREEPFIDFTAAIMNEEEMEAYVKALRETGLHHLFCDESGRIKGIGHEPSKRLDPDTLRILDSFTRATFLPT